MQMRESPGVSLNLGEEHQNLSASRGDMSRIRA